MIRAIVRNGVIHPIDPLPAEWCDGKEVMVQETEADPVAGAEETDNWYQEMQTLTADLNDPHEWEQIETTLAEADQHAKAVVRRQMELPE
jgi:hypothetical protein